MAHCALYIVLWCCKPLEPLGQWFFTSLVLLWSFNAVPYVVVKPTPTIKLSFFITVILLFMSHRCLCFLVVLGDPSKRIVWPQKLQDSQVENHCLIASWGEKNFVQIQLHIQWVWEGKEALEEVPQGPAEGLGVATRSEWIWSLYPWGSSLW